MTDNITIQTDLASIRPGRWQPRRTFRPETLLELATNIRDNGLITPPVVILDDSGNQNKFELIAGERRWRACCALAMVEAGYTSLEGAVDIVANTEIFEKYLALGRNGIHLTETMISVTVQDSQDDEHLAIISVADNLQRDDLNPIEEAEALATLKEAYGYSIRQLADVVGRSKSWVDDRLKLLDLSPEVQSLVAGPAQTDDDRNGQPADQPSAPLDLGLARLIARKIPADYQPHVARWIAENGGRDIKYLTTFVTSLAKFVDPATWTVSNDPNKKPVAQIVRNRARVITYLLQELDNQQIINAFGEMDLSIFALPTRILESSYHTGNIIGLLTDSPYADFESEFSAYVEQWGCHNCSLAQLSDLIIDRDTYLDGAVPCARFKKPEIKNCFYYLAKGDLQTLPARYQILQYLTEYDQVTGLIQYDNGYHFVSAVDLAGAYTQARANRQTSQAQEQTERREKYIADIEAYTTAVLDPNTPLDLGHFYAQPCPDCAHYCPDNDPPCAYARQPIPAPGDRARAPEFYIMLTQSGQVVPRCEMFRFTEGNCPDIPPVRLMLNADINLAPTPRAMLLDWFKNLVSFRALYNNSSFYGPLTWLPYKRAHNKAHNLPALLKYLAEIGDQDSGLMWALMHVGIFEFGTIGHNMSYYLPHPITGDNIDFVAISFKYYLAGHKPVGIPDGWPVPWLKEEEQK